MQLEFDATIEDYVDLHMRAFRTSALVRSFGRRDSVMAAVAAAAAAFLLARGSLTLKTVIAVCAAVIAVGLDLALRPAIRRRRLRRAYRETLKAPVVRYTVDLRPSGLWYSDGQSEVLTRWTEIGEVVDEGDGQPVVIRHRAGGLLIVRPNGFTDPQQRATFVAEIREYIRGANPHA